MMVAKNRTLCSLVLKIILHKCGTAIPIKAIGPQKAVVLPASMLVLMKTSNLVSFIFSPIVYAYFSPIKSASSFFNDKNESKSPVTRQIPKIPTCVLLILPKLPSVQITNDFSSVSLPKYCRILTTDEIAAPIIIPRIRIVIISRTFEETRRTSNNIAAAPIQAAIISAQLPSIPDKFSVKNDGNPITTKATPRLAPELIPRTSGPASGFRKIVCICSPLTLRAIPANIAANAFGNLKSNITTSNS